MTDVRLYQTDDGGEFDLEIGTAQMDDGVETALYLSMFGGNEDDSGGDDLSKQWWGNSLETDPKRMYRSQTQYLLRSLPTTSANVQRIKTAIKGDIDWMLEDGILSKIEIAVYIPYPKWIKIIVNTDLGNFDFTIPWEATV